MAWKITFTTLSDLASLNVTILLGDCVMGAAPMLIYTMLL